MLREHWIHLPVAIFKERHVCHCKALYSMEKRCLKYSSLTTRLGVCCASLSFVVFRSPQVHKDSTFLLPLLLVLIHYYKLYRIIIIVVIIILSCYIITIIIYVVLLCEKTQQQPPTTKKEEGWPLY